MKKKLLLLLLIFLFIPFIVNANRLDDLQIKWTENKSEDGYIYNPYLEIDANYFHLKTSVKGNYNQSRIIETNEGYIIIGNYTISQYNRKTGLEKSIEYDRMNYIIDKDIIYIISYNYQNHETTLEMFNNKLESLNSLTIEKSEYDYIFSENDYLIFLLQKHDSNKGNINTIITLDKKTFKKINQSTLITSSSLEVIDQKVFNEYRDNYYYLDENYNIIPQTLLNNNEYTKINFSVLNKYNVDGTEIKSVDLSPSSYSAKTQALQIVHNNKIYVGVQECLYDSSQKVYNNRAAYYLYDSELNLLNSKIITAKQTSAYEGCGNKLEVRMFQNEKGVFTSWDSKNYKIDSNFTFTETDSSNLYSDNKLPYTGKIEPNTKYQAFEEAGLILRILGDELESKLSEKYEYADVYPIYDAYFDEKKKELIINVTWLQRIMIDGDYTTKTKTELIIINEETTFENLNRIIISDEKTTKNVYKPNNVITVTDEYIILGITNEGITKILFYDHEYNLLKEFKKEETQDLSIQKIDYENRHLLLIYSSLAPMPGSIMGNDKEKIITTDATNNMKLNNQEIINPVIHQGSSRNGSDMLIEYYEAPFNIITKTNGNGVVEADHITAEGGTEVKFVVKPEEGYVLGEVKVTDSYGNVIIFTDYTFTMPSADVLIEAKFVPIEKNPDTSDISITFGIIIIIAGIIMFYNYKKRNKLN